MIWIICIGVSHWEGFLQHEASFEDKEVQMQVLNTAFDLSKKRMRTQWGLIHSWESCKIIVLMVSGKNSEIRITVKHLYRWILMD